MNALRLLLTRAPDAPPQSLEEYRAEGGYQALAKAVGTMPPAQVCAEVEGSLLRGRGGAGFPAGRKWRLALERSAPEKFVVANGGEHEPGSMKDRFLVEKYPHKVLEGTLLCGYATGASVGWLYLIEDMAGPIRAAEAAIAEMRAADLLGERILGSAFSFDVKIHLAPTTYVAGEETAALEAIEGRAAKPRSKPPYPGESGIKGMPTTVNNVETLAHVPAIVRNGAAWFRGIGRGESTGTMLFTLDERVNRPGVYELPFGATLRDLIYGCGGGPKSGRAIRAVLPALSCGFVGAEHLDLPMEHASFKAIGSSLGCGGVSFVEEGESCLDRLVEITRFFMAEQCGQCPPCRMETNHLASIVKGVREGKQGDHAGQIKKVTDFNRGKGKCSLIEMAAAPVLSALRVMLEDFGLPPRPA